MAKFFGTAFDVKGAIDSTVRDSATETTEGVRKLVEALPQHMKQGPELDTGGLPSFRIVLGALGPVSLLPGMLARPRGNATSLSASTHT